MECYVYIHVMRMLRPHIALALALMLGLTSLTLAMARGQAPAAGTIEICSGMGLQVITVDAEGNPVGAPHVCPDAIAAFVSVDAPEPKLPVRRVANGERLNTAWEVSVAEADCLRATARGPPVFV